MCRQTEPSEKVLESEEGAVMDVLKWTQFLVPSWIWGSMSPAWILRTLLTTKQSRDSTALIMRHA